MKRLLLGFCLGVCSLVAAARVPDARTRYPIVLVHGLFGFGRMVGIDYFYRIPETLRADGARVYLARVDPVNTSAARGEQLLAQVQRILAMTGAGKVNLIGHSQGAPTARYVAAVRPDLVASVTSVGGANQGSAVADRLLGRSPADDGWRAAAPAALAALTGQRLSLAQWRVALQDLTVAGSRRFNARFPQGLPTEPCGQGAEAVDGVRYYAWAGTAGATHPLDPLDLPLSLLSRVFDEPNDGLISRCSAHLGRVLRDNYRMNHADLINHAFGLVASGEVDPAMLYLLHARRLQQAGL